MSIQDLQRLSRELEADAGLKERVAQALSESPDAAATLLKGLGYDVTADDLQPSAAGEPVELAESDLDGVVGGAMPIKNANSPFD